MNKRNKTLWRVLRIAALAVSIALIFGSMAVFNADSVTHDDATHTLCAMCERCTTADCDFAEGVCPTDGSCRQHIAADTCVMCGGCNYGSDCYESAGVECALADCQHSSDDHVYNAGVCGTCPACGGRTCDGGCYEDPDSDGVYTLRTAAVCAGGCTLHSTDDDCEFCGGCTAGDKCYESVGVLCTDTDCDGSDHQHGDIAQCTTCTDCGGCICDMHCFDLIDGIYRRCIPCTCEPEVEPGPFDALYIDGGIFIEKSLEEIQAMIAAQGSIEINVGDKVELVDADGNTICNVSDALDDGAVIGIAGTAAALNGTTRDLIAVNGEPVFYIDYHCFEGAESGTVNATANVTITYDGVTKTLPVNCSVRIAEPTVNDSIVSVEPTENYSNVIVGDMQPKDFVFQITYADGYTDGCQLDLTLNDTAISEGSVKLDPNDPTKVIVTISSRGNGQNYFVLTVKDKDGTDVITKTVSFECEIEGGMGGDDPDVGSAPSGAVTTDPVGKVKEKTTFKIIAKGWYEGSSFATSTTCYVPVAWSINPSGTWAVPTTITEASLTQTATVAGGLPVGSYSPKVTFAVMWRASANDNWMQLSDTVTGTGTLKVVSAGTNINGPDSPGGGTKDPDTGDVTVKDLTGRNTAAILMLSAGLIIIVTLVAEYLYRKAEEKKVRAQAVRR